MNLVLFDIDGTLIRGRMGSAALRLTFAELFQTPTEFPAAWSQVVFNGRSDRAIFPEVARALGLQDEEFHARHDEFISRYYQHLEHTVRTTPERRVLPGVLRVLDDLHGRPEVVQGLLTGNLERGAHIKLTGMGLMHYFSFGGYAEDGVDRRDIARASYERGCRRVGVKVPADRVLVVGDTRNDVTAAKEHGFHVAGVATGGVPRDDLTAAGADASFETLENEFVDFLETWLSS